MSKMLGVGLMKFMINIILLDLMICLTALFPLIQLITIDTICKEVGVSLDYEGLSFFLKMVWSYSVTVLIGASIVLKYIEISDRCSKKRKEARV